MSDIADRFCLVDSAVGGMNHRNHVLPLSQLTYGPGARGVFTTWVRYDEGLTDWWKTHKNANGNNTVAGYRGLAWASYVPWDIDRPTPDAALTDARHLVRWLVDHWDIPLDAIDIIFSGKKGYHIQIPSTLFGGFVPSSDLPQHIGRLAHTLADGSGVAIDKAIYAHVWLWRMPNTLHNDVERYAIPLTSAQFLSFDVEQIQDLAKKPRRVPRLPDDEWSPRPELMQLVAPPPVDFHSNGKVNIKHNADGGIVIEPDSKEHIAKLLADTCYQGERHAVLLKLIGHFATRESYAVTLTILVEWGQTKCQPPVDFEDIKKQVDDAYPRYYEPWEESGDETPDETPKHRYTRYTLRDAFADESEVSWVVEGLLTTGSLSIFNGAPGSYKTWSAIDLALCVAQGNPWMGFETNQGPVLIIDEESGKRRLNDRLRRVSRGHDADDTVPISYFSLEGFNLREKKDRVGLQQVIAEQPPVLVIIDALADVMPGADENAVKDVQPVLIALRKIADAEQPAIVVLHHNNKQGGYRGSTAIPGAIDLMLMVSSTEGSNIIDFQSAKTRDIEPVRFSALFVHDDLKLSARLVPTGAPPDPKRSPSQMYVLRFLTANGASLADDIISKADTCSKGAARTALYRLAALGLVHRIDDGGRNQPAVYDLV